MYLWVDEIYVMGGRNVVISDEMYLWVDEIYVMGGRNARNGWTKCSNGWTKCSNE